MGHEYSSAVIIGFTMNQDEFLMPFKTTTDEKFHMEERFDSKTGMKLRSVKVVDEESIEGYVVEGITLENSYEVLETIAVVVGCRISSHGNMCSGDDFMIGIVPNGVETTDEVKLTDIPKLMEECQRIKAVFAKKFGIQLREPVVTTLDSYG